MALCREREGPGIIVNRTVSDVSMDSVRLPSGYSWDKVALGTSDSNVSLSTIKSFLDENYISDKDGKFRLQYSIDFIRNFLHGHPDWNAVIVADDEKDEKKDERQHIVGFIAAARRKVSIQGRKMDTAEVNLLCVHRDARHRCLAEYLIKEITRKVELQGIFTAIYTSGRPLPPESFSTARYHHKFLDVNKLNAVGYTQFAPEDLHHAIHYHQHKKVKKVINPMEAYILRPFLETDVATVTEMFESEMGFHVLQEVFDEEKLRSMLRISYFDNYIVEEVRMMKRTRAIVGFISVFHMDVIVLGDKLLATSYIYAHCGNVLPCISDLFALLQKQGKAVVNCLDIGKNKMITRTYNMLPGTGYLHYYMYNYRMPMLPPDEVAYMML